MPYAERYIDLVLERKWHTSRMHPRDVKKLDVAIEEALVDFESARVREDAYEREPVKVRRVSPPKSRKTTKLLKSWQGQEHPWQGRAVPPKQPKK